MNEHNLIYSIDYKLHDVAKNRIIDSGSIAIVADGIGYGRQLEDEVKFRNRDKLPADAHLLNPLSKYRLDYKVKHVSAT